MFFLIWHDGNTLSFVESACYKYHEYC